MENHQLIREEQHGFQKNKSCETQLVYTIHEFATILNDSGEVDALFLDFSKAFDKVPHVRLLQKLEHYRICPQLINWIKDFLGQRQQQVVLNGVTSEQCEVISGVPQGTVLGPLLFTCFINDLPALVNSQIRLYADDILIFRPIYSNEDTLALQRDLDAIVRWSEDWQLFFSLSKCVHLKITNRILTTNSTYFMKQHQICRSNNATYLGVTIDEHLKWTNHIQHVNCKANSANAFL